VEGMANALGTSMATGHGNHGMMVNVSQPWQGGSPNLPQPFYQTMAYRPQMSPLGTGPSYGPILNVLFPRTPAPNTQHIRIDRFQDKAMNDGVKEQIAQMLSEFGFTPMGRARAYQKPYPEQIAGLFEVQRRRCQDHS
jgi:hypothetical protein